MAQSVQIKKVAPWMERLADLLIAEPGIQNNELAKRMSKSYVWISIVKNSDVFLDYWKLRSQSHSEAVTAGIKEKTFALAEMALETMCEKVEEKREAGILTLQESLDVYDVALKRFGYGGKPGGDNQPSNNTTVIINQGLVNPEQLARAREKLRATEATAVEVLALPVPKASVG